MEMMFEFGLLDQAIALALTPFGAVQRGESSAS